MFQVAEVNSLAELKTYQLAWDELWERGRCKSFQTTYDWLVNYWQHTDDRELKVLVASLAGKVIGILPLVKKTVSTKLGKLRVLTYPLDNWGSWYGPIGPNTAATLTAGLRYLSQSPRDWDLIDLTYIDRDRFDLGRTQTAARNMGWGVCERIWEPIPVISLETNWTDFLSSKREFIQTQIFQTEQLAKQLGQVTFLRYRSEALAGNLQSGKLRLKIDPRAVELLELMQPLLQRSQTEKEIQQLQQMIEAADGIGNLDLAACFIDKQPVIASLGFQHREHLEIVRSFSDLNHEVLNHRLTETELQSLFLGRLLEEGTVRGDQTYELAPECKLAQTARKLWATEMLHSFRNTMAPLKHLRSSLLVKYHSLTSKPIPRRKIRIDPRSTPAAFGKFSALAEGNKTHSPSLTRNSSGESMNASQTLKLFSPPPETGH